MNEDPLRFLPVNKWEDLENVFCDCAWGIPVISLLQTQRKLLQNDFDYGFKVYCPFGDVRNGMVALNVKGPLNEIVIQCPSNCTTKLEEALFNTKLIDWKQMIMIPYANTEILECVQRLCPKVDANIALTIPATCFMIENQFEDFSLPEDINFDLLSPENVDLVDSVWPHQYSGSKWWFENLIKRKLGYGMFKDKELAAWIMINESGTLNHLYTLENYRRKGYGEIITKKVSNIMIEEKRIPYAFCVKGNVNSYNLFKKLGFKISHEVHWIELNGVY